MAVLLTGLLLAGCTGTGGTGGSGDADGSASALTSASSSASTATGERAELTLGLWGAKPVVRAYRRAVQRYNAQSVLAHVTLTVWKDREDAMSDIEAGDVPDIYLASRRDLAWLLDHDLTKPVDELLDERFVDFGDDYSRDALEAFSSDRRLQCMPTTVDPQVVYYNTDLIDFEEMAAKGKDVPSDPYTSWTFDQALVAARWATSPRHGDAEAGIYIDPSLGGIAAFLYSGGGQLFDDEDSPTSLALSSDSDVDALERILKVMRSSRLSLPADEENQADAVKAFEKGDLAMMVGTRSMVPELRKSGVSFDVMPIPGLDSQATVGETQAFCLDPGTSSLAGSADLLAYLVSDEVMRPVAATGYVVPANQSVALSNSFVQKSQQPAHASTFTYTLRHLKTAPLLTEWDELLSSVNPLIEGMVTQTDKVDVPLQTSIIDSLSREILPQPESSEESSDGASAGSDG
ncbi:extracellular solute-binding protein [Nocardioides sp. GY 10127]|uniref:ABC transporter substrate-binding protein n=1 Tax=Nocardioides sp. GY 10127 TaxID=2569762 RepID=UPI00145800C4|nr:extracellular solute-binding protein [Nocardioides sp. GY 10127]